jgi:hypothetical protein
VGVEVLQRDIVAGGADAAAKTLFESLRAVIEAARSESQGDDRDD